MTRTYSSIPVIVESSEEKEYFFIFRFGSCASRPVLNIEKFFPEKNKNDIMNARGFFIDAEGVRTDNNEPIKLNIMTTVKSYEVLDEILGVIMGNIIEHLSDNNKECDRVLFYNM